MSIRKGNTIIAGNIDAVYGTDEQTITINQNEKLEVIGTINKNTLTPKYDWVGTKAEYDALEEKNEEWLYFVTDDEKETVTLANCVGQIIQAVCTSSYIPNGCIPCDGTEYTADRFLDFWTNYLTSQPAKILTCTYNEYNAEINTYGQCAKFAVDTSSQKFKAPIIKDGSVIQQAMSDSELGKAYNAGLPNITGTGGYDTNTDENGNYWSGAFSYSNTSNQGVNGDGGSSALFTFDASRSSAVYGNSSTVQPNAVALRFFVVVVNTYLNQSQLDWTTYTQSLNNKADKNLANTGLITNCITEIPQDIKLELNNGVLILKAGSKVYVPNGFEADGTTPKFDVVVTSTDLSKTPTGNTNTMFIFYNYVTRTLTEEIGVSSGPTISPPGTYHTRYDTTINKIIRSINGSSWDSSYQNSFPIAYVTADATAGITNINNIFNGLGYIGSTVFALPGIKGLIPNGKNSDGSLKSLEFTIEGVKINTRADDRANTLVLSGNEISQQIFPTSWNYDSEKNIVYNVSANSQRNYCVIGQVSSESTKITSFTPKTVFRVVDYSEADFVIAYKRPTSTDSTWYRLYKSGWVEQGGRTYATGSSAQNITINLPIRMADTNYSTTTGAATGGSPSDGYAFWLGTYYNPTTVSFILKIDGTSYVSYVSWEVKGFAAGY